ncbi:MAG TPA: bifunctional diaminohydroxyphosphoribosylaminopyrimidine deaminase/5-amino-6-(5-phosphoribosylamino)uracil reductase RibD [Myxococcaceae bacterium]|nr:bifunctional diaminohydroxyphosphoribosylaminopyrimidine deaminase/5-amino-6-(5-phosphoribosylamino)uracil reductase RibD [Myxococcaceae bacterium]
MNATQRSLSPRAAVFMRAALAEATKGIGRTSPNPAVGAVLVKDGQIVGRGYHRRAGAPHAEVVAIKRAGKRARGAELYTTLEPCNHYGRTPPCTSAILDAGVARVICALRDPDPNVNGRGIARLRRAGIPVLAGVLHAEAARLNRPYLKHRRSGLPWVTLKAAITLDGKIATSRGDSRWVSTSQSRADVHRLRDRVDAILVGSNTARLDNPRLTTRVVPKGRNAIRVVLDTRLQLPLSLRLFRSPLAARTIVATAEGRQSARAKRLLRRGVEVWPVPKRAGRLDLLAVLRRLGKEGVVHLLVEGGAEVFGAFIDQGLADELLLFVAPKLVGSGGLSWTGRVDVKSMAEAIALEEVAISTRGQDVLVRGLLANRRRFSL